MADKNSGWSCTASASIISQTDTTATIRVTAYWRTGSWTYNVNWVDAWTYLNGESHQVMDDGTVNAPSHNTSYQLGYHDYVVNKTTSSQSIAYAAKITSSSSYVSGTKWTAEDGYITVPAKTSYTVSYNANGGSGAPGAQTKWYGTNLALSSTKPTRTGYSFSKWNTNSSGTGTSYNPGATYTGNANLALYAIWTANTYKVSYNANGGSGAPGAQTKTYGVNLTLSSTKPTRTNYTFLGWSTSAGGGVVYSAGATYTNNASVTLYAVWSLAYTKPRVTNFTAQRCDSAGGISEEGRFLKVTFNWATDRTVSGIAIQYKVQTSDSWTTIYPTASGTSGTFSQVIGDGAFDPEISYHVRVYVADSGGSTYSNTRSIGTPKYPIDVKADGSGVAIGKAAETSNLFDVNMAAKFNGNITWESAYFYDTDYNTMISSGVYYMVTGCANAPDGFNYCRLLVMGDSNTGDLAQIATHVSNGRTWIRGCSSGVWKNWYSINQVFKIGSSDNFNNFTYTGTYICGSAPTGANAPMEITGVLEVFNHGGIITQRYTAWNGTYIWVRGYYNGSWNTWKNTAGSKMATYMPSSRLTISGAAWTNLKIACDSGKTNTSYNTLTPVDGGIRIGKNINTVKISASLSAFNYATTGEVDLYILKNSTAVAQINGHCAEVNRIFNMTINPVGINVSEGDIIYLYVTKNTANDLTVIESNASTSLTVEVLN